MLLALFPIIIVFFNMAFADSRRYTKAGVYRTVSLCYNRFNVRVTSEASIKLIITASSISFVHIAFLFRIDK